jgi:hypothetical protein
MTVSVCNFDRLQIERNEKKPFRKTGVVAASGNKWSEAQGYVFTF